MNITIASTGTGKASLVPSYAFACRLREALCRSTDMDLEIILERLAIASLLPGFGLLFITIHVLHFSELKHGRKTFYFVQFWPFYKHFKSQYPEASEWARKLIYIQLVMGAPYCFWLLLH